MSTTPTIPPNVVIIRDNCGRARTLEDFQRLYDDLEAKIDLFGARMPNITYKSHVRYPTRNDHYEEVALKAEGIFKRHAKLIRYLDEKFTKLETMWLDLDGLKSNEIIDLDGGPVERNIAQLYDQDEAAYNRLATLPDDIGPELVLILRDASTAAKRLQTNWRKLLEASGIDPTYFNADRGWELVFRYDPAQAYLRTEPSGKRIYRPSRALLAERIGITKSLFNVQLNRLASLYRIVRGRRVYLLDALARLGIT